ncbi:MAG: hypothetical protein GXP37_12235 [Chloroflexi bacterium]|nr:hypothetical protein [Chloroflexota bacterium]
MYPTIEIGSVQVATYSLAEFLAVFVLFVGVHQRQRHLPKAARDDHFLIGFMLVVSGALLGAWLGANLPHLVDRLLGRQAPPLSWWQGRHWMGVVSGGALAGYLYCRKYGLPVGLRFDLFAPMLPLTLATVRLGCLAAGCCYGLPTDAWPGMVLPDINGLWVSRYPTRITSMIANILIALILLGFERYARQHLRKPRGWPFPGFLFLLYLQLYAIQRFFFEFWRADMPHLAGAFTWTHLYSLLWIVFATAGMAQGLNLKPWRHVKSVGGLAP